MNVLSHLEKSAIDHIVHTSSMIVQTYAVYEGVAQFFRRCWIEYPGDLGDGSMEPEAIEAQALCAQMGISELACKTWRVGWAPKCGRDLINEWLSSAQGEPWKTVAWLKLLGLAECRFGIEDSASLECAIVLPLPDEMGRIIGFVTISRNGICHRHLPSAKANIETHGYFSSTPLPSFENGNHLIGLHLAHDTMLHTGKVELVFRPLDFLRLFSKGYRNVVGFFGPNWEEELTRQTVECLAHHGVQEFHVWSPELSRCTIWPESSAKDENQDEDGTVMPNDARAQLCYLLRDTKSGLLKIGCSRDPSGRAQHISTLSGRPIKLLATLPGGRAREQGLHKQFVHLREAEGEWFKPSKGLYAEFGLGYPKIAESDANPETTEPQ